MEQVNINTALAEPVAEEVVEERPDGTVVRRRTVAQPTQSVEAGGVTVNVPPAGSGGPTNININS